MENNFIWGAASAAFQIEGGYREDGKGDSIWDVFTHEAGRTKRGDNGDVTCDHYHRYKEDVKMMADLGLHAYRFSVAWTRIFPNGIGEVNEKGIAFYNNLIDELLKYGIEPYLTLYHWDLPQKLFERGGWLNPDSPDWFYQYAKVIGERFGDRVKNFITINEPSNIIEGMMPGGGNAPGLAYTLRDRLTAVHNVLKAHGKAVLALRETVADVKVGFAPNSSVICPADFDEKTIAVAKERYFALDKDNWLEGVTLFSDPVFLGDYPTVYYEYYKDILPDIKEGDMELISQPLDFCFQNIYAGTFVSVDESGNCVVVEKKGTYNMLGWNVTPEAMYWGTKFLYERYQKPIYITENGFPNADMVSLDGKVHDPERIDFIQRYTQELKKAEAEGVDIRGYFYWSIMDNLEWELGYESRFGLIYVDFETLERIPKDSYYYYKEMIQRKNYSDWRHVYENRSV